MGSEIAVELRDVVKRFVNVTAVNRISLQVRDGEFFSLLGPSGCGKTTTLRLIAGFEIPTSGEVFIGGEPQGYLPAYKRPVNTVFQHYALFPHMSVRANVAFGLEMRGFSKQEINHRVGEALEMVHLKGMENRKPKQLSGGQQQRVALARALVNRPKVLLLDEPLGALDLKLRKAMQVELKTLQNQVGITFIYVTHDQEEALTMSDRIGVMDQGRLLQVGSAQEVYENPNSRFVSDFIGETNYLEGWLVSIHDDLGEIAIGEGYRILSPLTPGLRTGQQVTIAFRPEKAGINIETNERMNSVPGRITHLVYTGSSTTYLVTIADGTVLTVRRQNLDSSIEPLLRSGEMVTVSWPILSTRTFAE